MKVSFATCKGACMCLLLSISFVQNSFANSVDQAYRIYSRINGVPPSDAVKQQLVALIDQGDIQGAVYLAMENTLFYDETLKKMFAPWSNEPGSVTYTREDGSPGIILNDYTATLIGMVRDDKSFLDVLSHDYIYVAEGAGVPQDLPAYSPLNNDHYNALEAQRVSLKDNLVERSQADLIPAIAGREAQVDDAGNPLVPAGIMTSRAFSEAYYNDGTNRAPFRFLLLTYFCEDIQAFHDTTIVTDRVRRDVERNALFVNKCQGCHSGMDAFTGAFAYLDWDPENNKMLYSKPLPASTLADLTAEGGDFQCENAELGNNPTAEEFDEYCVRPKYRRNRTQFVNGSKTTDDGWINYWNQGQNTRIGWAGQAGERHEGNGPKSFGSLLTNTEKFPTCMAQKVFKQVCFRSALNTGDDATIKKMSQNFKQNGYKMKGLFAEALEHCAGE